MLTSSCGLAPWMLLSVILMIRFHQSVSDNGINALNEDLLSLELFLLSSAWCNHDTMCVPVLHTSRQTPASDSEGEGFLDSSLSDDPKRLGRPYSLGDAKGVPFVSNVDAVGSAPKPQYVTTWVWDRVCNKQLIHRKCLKQHLVLQTWI